MDEHNKLSRITKDLCSRQSNYTCINNYVYIPATSNFILSTTKLLVHGLQFLSILHLFFRSDSGYEYNKQNLFLQKALTGR